MGVLCAFVDWTSLTIGIKPQNPKVHKNIPYNEVEVSLKAAIYFKIEMYCRGCIFDFSETRFDFCFSKCEVLV